jgi:uncharacterized membrane protein
LALLTAARGVWAAEIVQLALLLVVPGALLLDALRVPRAVSAAFPVYVPVASIAVLFFCGLGVDLLGPLLGVRHPLSPAPLLVSLEIGCVALLGAARDTPTLRTLCRWSAQLPSRRSLPLLLPLLAAAGAVELNTHHGPSVAIAAAVAAAALLVYSLVRANTIDRAQLSILLYAVGLAAIWSTSLRGQFPFGFDIASEARDAASTAGTGIWHAPHSHDAYGAMLSVTVFPAMLHALSGASTSALLKAVYPALFALFPVGIFAIAARFLPPWYAFLAGAYVIAQGFFFESIPVVARQEIGLLAFLALVAAVLERKLAARRQWSLIVIFAAAVSLAHYSSTYIAVGTFAISLVVELALSALRRAWRPVGALVVALVATVVSAAIWYGPVTHSSANLRSFVSSVQSHGLDLLPNAGGRNPIAAYLVGNTTTKITAHQYGNEVALDYAQNRRYVHPLPSATDPRYALRDAVVPHSRVRLRSAVTALTTSAALASQLGNLLAVLGVIVLLARRRSTPFERRMGVLGGATLLLLAVSRFSGTIAGDYNQERALVQALIVLAPALAWFVQRICGGARPTAPLLTATSVVVALLFASSLGLGSLLLAAAPTRFANAGEDYERFYVTAPELRAATWVSAAPHGALIYTDRYGALRLLEATGRSNGSLQDVTPRTLDMHAWIYASPTNVTKGRARAQIRNQYVLYRWPARFINDNFDLVYTNGTSEVFHR